MFGIGAGAVADVKALHFLTFQIDEVEAALGRMQTKVRDADNVAFPDRLAGIVEFGGLEAPPSRGPFDLLRRAIARTMPGLTWKHQTEWMGHRPATVDSIPLIGPAPKLKGAWLGFGHQHVGLTGGPKTGRILAQMIAGRAPNLDLTPYTPRSTADA